ncbi:MAG: alanyl-tRNA editing protein [Burkholderiales bacterium]
MTQLLFRDDAYLRSTTARVMTVTETAPRDGSAPKPAVVLDQTVCYYESGGQPGDAGELSWSGGSATIIDTRRDRDSGAILHVLAEGAVLPAVGEDVTVTLDWPRRHQHMRYHTALHLICAALPGILATGNAIDTTKARIDFDLSGVAFDRDATEARLNELIAGNHDVTTQWISDEEMAAQPELVRTMSVAPPTGAGRVRLLNIGNGVDLQPCGGTHVKNTREIGPVQIVKVENKGKQNRRLVIQLLSASD